MSVAGKRVLITGGGTGVGADLATGFAAAGAEVVICGRREGPLASVAERTGARFVTADVTSEADVKRLFAEAGPCDIVIANAGGADSAPLGRTTLEQWNAMLAVNLTGTFLTFREGLAQMPGWGRLIAVASTAGLKGYAYVAPYVAAKHGVVGLMRALATEFAQTGVTVNAVCPGFVETDMLEESVARIVATTGRSEADARAALAATNPQGRFTQPEGVAAAGVWRCGAAAGSITGQTISISGGETW